jgi:hypothetical protein
MLELDGVLMTWSVAELPAAWTSPIPHMGDVECIAVAATRLADHRMAYLDYEGPLSGDRGTVSRADRGDYDVVAIDDLWLEVALDGELARGRMRLPTAPPSP